MGTCLPCALACMYTGVCNWFACTERIYHVCLQHVSMHAQIISQSAVEVLVLIADVHLFCNGAIEDH